MGPKFKTPSLLAASPSIQDVFELIGLIHFFIFPFYHEKAAEALCVGRIQTRSGVALFPIFPVEFFSDFSNLLLATLEIIIVKHLVQGHNNETRLGVEPLTLRSWSS